MERPYSSTRHGPGYPGDDERQVNLTTVIQAIWRGKWILLLSFVLIMGGVTAYTFLVDPEYETYAIVKVDTKGPSSMSSVLTFGTEDRALLNELEFLKQSLRLAERVARRLQEIGTDSLTGKPLPILYSEEGDTLAVPQIVGKLLRGQVTFALQTERVDMIRITASSTLPAEARLIANLYAEEYQRLSREYSRQDITASRRFLQAQLAKRRRQLDSLETQLAAYMREEGIVALDAESNVLVQQLAQLDGEIEETRVSLELERASLKALEDELNRVEPGLADRIASGVEGRITALQHKIATLENEAEEYYARDPSLRGNEEREPQLLDILQRKAELQRVLQAEADRYAYEVSSVGIVSAEVGGDGLKAVAALKDEIVRKNITIQGLEAKLAALQARLRAREQRQEDLPTKTIRLAQLERSRESLAKLYEFLSAKVQEAQVAEESELGYVELIREALLPGRPVRPDTVQNLLLGFLVSLVFGLGLAFLRQALDQRIHTPDDVRHQGLSLIGVVPRFDRIIRTELGNRRTIEVNGTTYSTSLITLYNPLSPITEAYRGILTNIQFSRPDAVIQTILLTSTEPDEGKTVTALNLAITMARGGRRTLYIDADLRNPSGHKFLGQAPEPGLTDVLFADQWDDFFAYTSSVENLYVLPAGKTVPNPAELLGSRRMRELLHYVRDHFDYIVIDSPPVLRATDAVLLSTQSDATIPVLGARQTTRYGLTRTREVLGDVGAQVIGAVLNRFDAREAGPGYGYGYGYGYYGVQEGKSQSRLTRVVQKVLG
ncbi:MAG: hypothetical protein KatS3mg044_0699 [Rhodothermaceae bacterium]|nr:MAG: hypothetical protein KatS3mg044_0699 [Rhodothermaceae bacterium]